MIQHSYTQRTCGQVPGGGGRLACLAARLPHTLLLPPAVEGSCGPWYTRSTKDSSACKGELQATSQTFVIVLQQVTSRTKHGHVLKGGGGCMIKQGQCMQPMTTCTQASGVFQECCLRTCCCSSSAGVTELRPASCSASCGGSGCRVSAWRASSASDLLSVAKCSHRCEGTSTTSCEHL
jgi:hypothetical protein